MKKGMIIVNSFLNNERFNVLYEMLIEAFLKRDIELKKVTNQEILTRIDLDKKDNNINFIIFWDKDILLAQHLENIGYKVYNSAKSITLCDDKGLTALALENENISMPKTIFAPFVFENINYNDYSFIELIEKTLSYPMIVKENKGSFGKQVYLANNKEELINLIKAINPKPMLFQEYIEVSKGKDVRVEVVGGKAINAVVRIASGEEFRSNVLAGGKMIPCNLINKDEYLRLAEKISKLLSLDFGGIDFLIGKNNEPIFCEANSNVHFRTFSLVTNDNLAEYLAEYIINNIK